MTPFYRMAAAVGHGVLPALQALVTPLLEKHPAKTIMLDAPLVFSMARVIVLAFACGLLREIWRAGIAGWPEATLAIAIVLAIPILGALDRVEPAQVLDIAKALFERFGVGGLRTTPSVYTVEPSKYGDHRSDAT